MTDQAEYSVLQRMTMKLADVAQEVPLTSSRAVRVAVTRAADMAHGLVISVQGLQEESVGHDGLANAIVPEWLMLGLHRDGGLTGFFAVDQELRDAVLELQTMGKLSSVSADERAPTDTDAMLLTPLLGTILRQLEETTVRTDLDGWVKGTSVDARIPSARSAGLGMEDCEYRVIRLTVDLGVGERQGALAILLPAGAQKPAEVVDEGRKIPWNPGFRKAVTGAPACLTAVLHKLDMPLAAVDQWQVGQVISLPGCTTASVRLTDPSGRTAAHARLGQYAGMRAVRLVNNAEIEMTDMDPPAGSDMLSGQHAALASPDPAPAFAAEEQEAAMGEALPDAGEGFAAVNLEL